MVDSFIWMTNIVLVQLVIKDTDELTRISKPFSEQQPIKLKGQEGIVIKRVQIFIYIRCFNAKIQSFKITFYIYL